jgi:cytochrome oxidase Cu insertion factor (SCO1/SenC/PrrC family)
MSSVFARAAVAAALLVGAAPLAAGRQQPAPPTARPIDLESLGPKIGQAVPSFTLSDQNGTPRALSSLLGPKGAILVFFRSADW